MSLTDGQIPLLQPIAAGLWIADGPPIRFYGMPYPTRMVVLRLADGGLWLHSPIAMTPPLIAALRALGPVAHLVSPNFIHYAGLPAAQAAFPEARCWAAPGVRDRAAHHGAAIRWDADLAPAPPPDWAGQIDQLILTGSRAYSEVVFFHRASRSLILTDAIENMPAAGMPFWMRPLARLGGVMAPHGGMPRDIRASFDRQILHGHVTRMLGWAPERVIFAHGDWFRTDGAARLRQCFAWLLPPPRTARH